MYKKQIFTRRFNDYEDAPDPVKPRLGGGTVGKPQRAGYGAAQSILARRRQLGMAKPIRTSQANDLSKPVRFPVKGSDIPTNPVIRPGDQPSAPRNFAAQPANDLVSVGDRFNPMLSSMSSMNSSTAPTLQDQAASLASAASAIRAGAQNQPAPMDSGYLRTGISDRERQVRNPIIAARRRFNRID